MTATAVGTYLSVFQVNLVSQHNKREVLGIPGAGLDEKLISPAVEGFESVGGSHIKHQNTAICTSVEGHTKRLEPFLTGCIPDLQDTKHLVFRRCWAVCMCVYMCRSDMPPFFSQVCT